MGLTVIAKSDADEGVSPDLSAGGQRRHLAKDFENLAELWAPRLHRCPQAACQGVGQSAPVVARRSRCRRRTAVVGSVKGRSPAPTGTGKMRRFPTFAG